MILLRIDTSYNNPLDIQYSSDKSQVNSVEINKSNKNNAAAAETNSTVKDFKKALGPEDFEMLIDSIKNMPTVLNLTRLEYSIHDDTKRIVVRIYNKATDELISEIPPEKFLDLIAGLWKQAGLIVDERV
ncbi:MAG: flagellar protein FlaG [Tepidanaerobacteraceae bacterium]